MAAGEAAALQLAEVCAAAGVKIVRRNLIQSQIIVGQTQAVTALRRCLLSYGRNTLIKALRCITQTADGNAGFVRATIIETLCEVLHAEPIWTESEAKLLSAMEKFSFPDIWEQVSAGGDQIFPSTAKKMVADSLRKFLKKKLSQPVGKIAA